MSRLALILLLSWAYVGCATRSPTPVPPPPTLPGSGGELRILVGSGLTADEVESSAVSRSLSPGAGIVNSMTSMDRPDGVCFTLGISGSYPGGAPVRSADLVKDWETRLRDPNSALRWLLHDLQGVESFLEGNASSVIGLVASHRALGVCLTNGGGDFEERLSHPALAHRREGGSVAVGPAPFLAPGPETLVADRDHAGRPSGLARIRPVESEEDPRLLFRLDEVDLAMVHGRTAAALLDDGDPAIRLRRIDGWERRYFLWLDSSPRWLSDPAFRVWMADNIDREGLVRFLFGGRGRPIFSLSPTASERAVWAPSTKRPFDSTSRPRLTLDYDEADDLAAALAARIRATLALAGVEVELRGAPIAQLYGALARGETSVVLLVHRPALFSDPVLGLLESLWWLGPGAERAVRRLLRASGSDDAGVRADAAWLAEYELLTEVRLVPLVGLESWLAGTAGLEGVAAGPAGRLELEQARWVP